MNVGTCFVIQPFDKGKFDERYEDIFSPAITACGLEPYRVDRDPSVVIPIDEIENGIRNSRLCLADITLDNPNVWFELGYALACGKDVVLISSNERDHTKPYPFDVRHRNIIPYTTNSTSSYKKLEDDITTRMIAILKKQQAVASINPVVAESSDLSELEITALAIIMASELFSVEGVSIFALRNDMEKSGYTEIAVSLGIKKLLNKSMIKQELTTDYNGHEFFSYTMTKLGDDWILRNEDKINLKNIQELSNEELPF